MKKKVQAFVPEYTPLIAVPLADIVSYVPDNEGSKVSYDPQATFTLSAT